MWSVWVENLPSTCIWILRITIEHLFGEIRVWKKIVIWGNEGFLQVAISWQFICD